MVRFTAALLLGLALAAVQPSTVQCELRERPEFPQAMTYTVDMINHANGWNFTGTHYLDVSKNMGRVEWLIDTQKGSFPFMMVFFGNEKVFYQVSANKDGSADCGIFDWETEVFNPKWNENATYEGVHWFEGRLTHKWSNILPFFRQMNDRPSVYYQDFFTEDPVMLRTPSSTLKYRQNSIIRHHPDVRVFESIKDKKSIKCTKRDDEGNPLELMNAHVHRLMGTQQKKTDTFLQ
eukprot:GDKI01033642.1.p1 GENE.GDKI01033642.1~~GDKI01033642.1.p1  ORF type:complete len:254 (-),score=56.74 GDKI01033642.1:296-1000(-)